jgi:hypothetical protein
MTGTGTATLKIDGKETPMTGPLKAIGPGGTAILETAAIADGGKLGTAYVQVQINLLFDPKNPKKFLSGATEKDVGNVQFTINQRDSLLNGKSWMKRQVVTEGPLGLTTMTATSTSIKGTLVMDLPSGRGEAPPIKAELTFDVPMQTSDK